MKHYPTPSLCQNKISFPLQQAKHESCISFVWLKNDHSTERHTRCAFSGANDRTQSSYRQRVINRSRSGTSVNENPCICFGTRLESIDSAETFSCERLVGNHSSIKNTFSFAHTPHQDLIACIRRETRLPCFGESSDLFSSFFFFFQRRSSSSFQPIYSGIGICESRNSCSNLFCSISAFFMLTCAILWYTRANIHNWISQEKANFIYTQVTRSYCGVWTNEKVFLMKFHETGIVQWKVWSYKLVYWNWENLNEEGLEIERSPMRWYSRTQWFRMIRFFF